MYIEDMPVLALDTKLAYLSILNIYATFKNR